MAWEEPEAMGWMLNGASMASSGLYGYGSMSNQPIVDKFTNKAIGKPTVNDGAQGFKPQPYGSQAIANPKNGWFF